jgi:hypothetical protein
VPALRLRIRMTKCFLDPFPPKTETIRTMKFFTAATIAPTRFQKAILAF